MEKTSRYLTIDEVNKKLEEINSDYRLDFDYLVSKRPFKERRGIIRTDKKSYIYRSSSESYLVGALPENIKFILNDNPIVRIKTKNYNLVPERIPLRILLERINDVKNGKMTNIFPQYRHRETETNIYSLLYREKQNFRGVPIPERINRLFKLYDNFKNYRVIKIVDKGIYNYKDINPEKKSYIDSNIVIKDTAKPDTYYVGPLYEIYEALESGEREEVEKILKRAYFVKYINKLLAASGIKVILDYDDDKILSRLEISPYNRAYARALKLKCINGHEIKEKYTLDELLNIINEKKEISCPYCSGEIKKEHGTSFPEKWFYEQLVSKIDDSKYRDKIKISELNNKEELDTKYQGKNQNQDIDILIKFPNEIDYKGKKIKGIGVACNGPLYHSYDANKGNQKGDYNNTNINDTIRYNSAEYIILNWNERGCSTEKGGRESANSFIENRIFPILRSIFEGNREIYDQETYSRQMQQQRLGEIAQALNDKCKVFEYGNIKIENLGKYFLLNKKRLTYTDGVYDKDKVRVWAEPLSDKFKLDDSWKKEVYNIILHNDDYLKANKISKGTVDYINKNSRDTNLNLKQYDKVRERRQFARLFEEIKKRTSK